MTCLSPFLPFLPDSLLKVNQRAAALDISIAEKMMASTKEKKGGAESGDTSVDGLIMISADVGGVNKHVVEAAKNLKIPVVGTGEEGKDMSTYNILILQYPYYSSRSVVM